MWINFMFSIMIYSSFLKFKINVFIFLDFINVLILKINFKK